MKKLTIREKVLIFILLIILLFVFLNLAKGELNNLKAKSLVEKRKIAWQSMKKSEEGWGSAYQEDSAFCLIDKDCYLTLECYGCASYNRFYKDENDGSKIDLYGLCDHSASCGNKIASCVSNVCVIKECSSLLCNIKLLIN